MTMEFTGSCADRKHIYLNYFVVKPLSRWSSYPSQKELKWNEIVIDSEGQERRRGGKCKPNSGGKLVLLNWVSDNKHTRKNETIDLVCQVGITDNVLTITKKATIEYEYWVMGGPGHEENGTKTTYKPYEGSPLEREIQLYQLE